MTQPIAPWAATPNYPSGGNSWSGTPTKVAPAVTYLTPDDPSGLSAQNLNWLLNQRDAVAGQVALGVWAGAAANWNDPARDVGLPSLPLASPACAGWDPFFQQWLLAGVAGGDAFLSFSPDGGKSWTRMSGTFPTPTRLPLGVATVPTSGNLAVVCGDGSTASVVLWTGGVGAPTETAQSELAGANLGVLSYWNGAFWFVGSSGLSSSSWTGFCASSVDGAGVWASSALPTGWSAGAGNPLQQYLTAQSPTALAVAMCGTTPGESTSRLMMQTTSAGWLDVTPSVLGGTSQQIRGLTYGVNDGLWGLLAIDAGGNSYLYTSPDLSTWTAVQTFTGIVASGLATLGSVWTVLAYNVAAKEAGNRILYSTNVGAQGAACTWAFAAYAEDAAAISVGLLLGNAGGPGGAVAGGVDSAPNTVGSQLLRVTIRPTAASLVVSSQVAGFTGAAPTAPVSSTGGAAGAPPIVFTVDNTGGSSVTAPPSGATMYTLLVQVLDAFTGGTVDVGCAGSTTLLLDHATTPIDLTVVGTTPVPVLATWPSASPVLVTMNSVTGSGQLQVLVQYAPTVSP